MFGEIDCREGLLLAVDKLKYSDMDEAMSVLADIYLEVLLGTVRRHDLRIYVHPVPPVLKETRHIVTAFNDLMKGKVPAASHLHVCHAKRNCVKKLHQAHEVHKSALIDRKSFRKTNTSFRLPLTRYRCAVPPKFLAFKTGRLLPR
jgi:hypothetical protein